MTTRGNQKLTQNVTKSRDVRGGIIHVKKVDESQEQKLTRLNKEPADGGRRRIVEQLRVGGGLGVSADVSADARHFELTSPGPSNAQPQLEKYLQKSKRYSWSS